MGIPGLPVKTPVFAFAVKVIIDQPWRVVEGSCGHLNYLFFFSFSCAESNWLVFSFYIFHREEKWLPCSTIWKIPLSLLFFSFFIVSFYSHGLTWILCYFGQCSVMGSLTKEFLKSFSSIFKLISHSSEVVKLLQLVSCLIEAIVFPEFFFFFNKHCKCVHKTSAKLWLEWWMTARLKYYFLLELKFAKGREGVRCWGSDSTFVRNV